MLKGKASKNRILLLLLLLISVMFSLQGCKAVGQTTIALEQSVRCGMEEHIHGEDCYLGDVLLCGKKAHTHGENCYIVRLDDNDINHLLGRVDETEDHSLESLIGNVLRGALGLDPLSPTPTPTPLPEWEAIDDGNALTNDDIMMINRAITDGVVKADIVLNERLLTVHSSGSGMTEAEALAQLAQTGNSSEVNESDNGLSQFAVGSEESDEDYTANFYIKLDGSWTHVGTLEFDVAGSKRNYSRNINNTDILDFVNDIVDPDINSISSLNMEFGTNQNNISSTASVGNTTTTFGTGIRNSSTANSTIYVRIVDLNFYTVKWANYDGTVLETDIAAEGATPVYNSATPTRAEDTQYTYTFSGWTPTVSVVTGKVTYTATYTATSKAYTATFENLSGTKIATDISGAPINGKLNITLPALSGEYAGYLWIVKGSDGTTYYKSDGTEKVDITGNTTFVAIPSTYAVTFVDGETTTTQEVPYGTVITFTKPQNGNYWASNNIAFSAGETYTVVSDVTFTATDQVSATYIYSNGTTGNSGLVIPGTQITLPTLTGSYVWIDRNGNEYSGGTTVTLNSNMFFTQTPKLTINYDLNFPGDISSKTFYPEGGLGSDPGDFNINAVGVPKINANMGSSYEVSGVTWADAPHTAEGLNYREVFYLQSGSPAYEYRSVYFRGWQVTVGTETLLIEPGEAIGWDQLLEMAGDGTEIDFTGLWEDGGYTTVTFYVNYAAAAANAGGDYGGGSAADYTPEVFCGHLFGLPSTELVGTGSYNTYYGITGADAIKSNLADAKIRELYGAGVSYDGLNTAMGDAITGGDTDAATTLRMTDFPTDAEVLAKIKAWYQNGDLTETLMYDDGTGKTDEVPDLDELDTNHYTIRWYVFKSQDDGWHVDGRLIRKVGNIKVTKTFEGNPELVEEAINAAESYGTALPFITASCAYQADRVVELYFAPKSDAVPYGYTYDSATGEYYWVIDEVFADDKWVIQEAPPQLQYSLSVSEYMWNNIIKDASGSGTGVELTMDGGTYPADAYDLNWIRADFTNIYHKEDTILVRKVDGKTSDGITGAVFNLYSDEIASTDDEPQLMYFKPVTKTAYEGTENELTYTIYEYNSEYDASTGVCDLPVGANGYLEYVVSGFSYETHNIIVTEKTAPTGYAAVGDIVVGYTTGSTIGIKNSAGNNAAEYSNGVLTVKNYSGGTATVRAEKIWDCDEVYYDGFAVRFELYANGTVASAAIPGFTADFGSYYVYLDENGAYVETNDDGTPKYLSTTPWSYTWSGLPTVLSGSAVTYKIVETQIGSEVADRTGNFPNWIADELYNNITTDAKGNQTVEIAIRNTPNRAMIRLTKYDTQSATLPGAEFVMSELDSNGNEVGRSRTATTGEYGGITFDNLKYETWYKLTETSPPPGHISLCDTVYVKLAATGVVTVTTDMNDASATSPYAYYPNQANNVYVVNLSAEPLPETGGSGTTPYTLGGALLIAAALLMIYRKSRRKEDVPYV